MGEPERMPVNMYGRRRVGKSWLLRRFAHGKPAVILASERLAPGTSSRVLRRCSRRASAYVRRSQTSPPCFVSPYRLASKTKVLVVIDEFPWLLPGTEAEIERR